MNMIRAMLLTLQTGHIYDTDSGDVFQLKKTEVTMRMYNRDGYAIVKKGGKEMTVHRLAYEAAYGKIQAGLQIDHIDCCKTNNRLSNLRAVTPLINQRNRKPCGDGLFPGIRWSNSKEMWISRVEVQGDIHESTSNDARKLYAWYYDTKVKYHGEDSVRHHPIPKRDFAITVARKRK